MLYAIHWREGARVDAAVQRFAEIGEGDLVRLRDDDAVTVRLRVPPYGTRITLDRIDGILTVWSVYRLPITRAG
jgi:hypothetical protein